MFQLLLLNSCPQGIRVFIIHQQQFAFLVLKSKAALADALLTEAELDKNGDFDCSSVVSDEISISVMNYYYSISVLYGGSKQR